MEVKQNYSIDKTRQDKTRQDKTRQDKTRQAYADAERLSSGGTRTNG